MEYYIIIFYLYATDILMTLIIKHCKTCFKNAVWILNRKLLVCIKVFNIF